MRSIEKQLSLSLGVSLLLIFGLFWWLTLWSIHQLTENYMLDRLTLDAQEIHKHLQQDKQSQLTLEESSLNPAYSQNNSGLYFVLKGNGQTIHSSSLGSFEFTFKPLDSGEERQNYEIKGPVEEKLLVLHQQTNFKGIPVDIYVAEDHAEIEQTLSYFDMMMVGFIIITLFVLYWTQKRLLRRGFQRLDPIYQALDNLHLGEPLKLNPEDYPEEVGPLVEKLNDAWQRLDRQLRKTRQKNADLAHGLKTPLNILYQLQSHPAVTSTPEVFKIMEEQTSKIYNRLETELKAAQVAADSNSLERFSLENDLPDLIDSFKQLYPQKHFTLNLSLDDKTKNLPIEKQDGYELLGNLLDNAAKFATKDYSLSIRQQGSAWILEIEDDGCGVPEEQYQDILKRGFRLDQQTPGHGVGLSIVQALVEAYHMELNFAQASSGSGLKVTVYF